MKRIDAKTLKGWIGDGRELAILDAREEGGFGPSHLFWAVPCPLSRREIRARALLPRLSTRIVCVDDGRGLAERLAEYLEAIGATDVAVLDGGCAPAHCRYSRSRCRSGGCSNHHWRRCRSRPGRAVASSRDCR